MRHRVRGHRRGRGRNPGALPRESALIRPDGGAGDWRGSDAVRIVGGGLSLALVLAFPRAQLVSFHHNPSLVARVGGHSLAAYYDLVYAAALTLLFLVPVLLASRRGRPSRWWRRGFVAAGIVSVLAAFANVRIVSLLGRPISYQWLYYSDFLRAQDARNAISEELTWGLVLASAAGVAAFLVLARVFSAGLAALRRALGPSLLAAIVVAAAVAYFVVGGVLLSHRDWDVHTLQSPLFSLVRSYVVARRSPQLLTMPTSVGTGDFEPPRPAVRASGSAPSPAGTEIRNVIVVVLESVPSRYLEPYSGPYAVTPELMRARERSLVFDRIYANCPTSSFSLVSLLLSIYGGLSFEGLTDRHPEVAFPSIGSELKRRSYRTGYFSSSDLRHEHGEVFLAHRGFDVVKDQRDIPCDTPVYRASTPNWPFLDGVDDACTASALLQWSGTDSGAPYFAVLWTMMTHFPYFAGATQTDFGVGEKFNRYLNGLRHGDRMIGNLLRVLEQRGQARSTLVVVVGDHGESFGQHGQWTHAQNLYEESVHVPLLFINPAYHGERSPAVGGIIDVAPTILAVLGFEPPPVWQGRSLFAPDRSGRAYFFAPWADLLFGFREGDRKVIYDASDNHFEVYDLESDPEEASNRAANEHEATRIGAQRLAAWAQYQDRMMRELLADGPR